MTSTSPFTPLTPEARAYLASRGLLPETVERYGLQSIVKDGPRIAIPVKNDKGDVLLWKCRALPEYNTSEAKMVCMPSGVGMQLFGSRILAMEGVTRVVICEGEMDCMMLMQANVPAVTSTAGAGSFDEEWLKLFPQGMEVVLCFDHDEAGTKGRAKIADLFMEKRPDCPLYDIVWASDKPKGYDVTDWFLGAIGRDRAALGAMTTPEARFAWCEAMGRKLMAKAKESGMVVSKEIRRVAAVAAPAEPVEFAEWREFVGSKFPKLAPTAEVCASVVAQLLIPDVHNPFALVVCDKSSGGKTIVLNFFKDLEGITYLTSDFSPAAFVTNIAGRTKAQLEQIDLLPRIRWQTLMVKDMAPILSDNDDKLRKTFGMLIDILDGQGFRTESGVHGSRGYKGDYLFMMLTASTPWAPRIWKLLANLGQRFFFVELGTKRKSIEELRAQISGESYVVKETLCREWTHDFLKTLWSRNKDAVAWDFAGDESEAKDQICRYADFLAQFRGDVFVMEERWTDGRSLGNTQVKVEDASRCNQCLYNLARGHAVCCGRNHITKEDLAVVQRVVLSSAPDPRPRLWKALLRKGGKMTMAEIEVALEMSRYAARKEMRKMELLDLCTTDLQRDGATNDWGMVVDEEGQHKKTIVMKQRYRWWFDLRIEDEEIDDEASKPILGLTL